MFEAFENNLYTPDVFIGLLSSLVGHMVLPTMAHRVFGAGLVFMWDGAQGERFNFCFSRVFC